MKRSLLKLSVAILLPALVVGIAWVVLLDRDSWMCSHRISTSLNGARAVTITEYAPGRLIARKTATPDEIAHLRTAASQWFRPFRPDVSGCWEPHHSVEIIQADGSQVTVEICFLCGKFGFLSDNESVVPIPTSVKRSLTVFFTSIGMRPKSYDEYLAMETSTSDPYDEKAKK
jgi:hypothetical protein